MKHILITICCVLFSISIAQVANTVEGTNPKKIGEKISESKLLLNSGKAVTFSEIANNKKSIIIVYRGGWCPYCTNHFKELAEVEEKAVSMGYEVFALSPSVTEESPMDVKQYQHVQLGDPTTQWIQEMGLAYTAPKHYEDILKKDSGDKNSSVIPVPAVYIIDADGTILFQYIDVNFKNRMSADILLPLLKTFSADNC